MKLKELKELLRTKEILTTIKYDEDLECIYLDLQTDSKSHLYLYEDGVIKGRYEYSSIIDLSQDLIPLLRELCYEFIYSLHGRDYYQDAWRDLCLDFQIEIKN